MHKGILIAGGVLGFLAVILGAFGAHALKSALDAEALKTFETGVKYQMYHALLLLFVGSLPILTSGTKNTILYLVVIGVILFSGSIYGLATNALTSFDFKKIGFVTPIGGTLLIISWGILIYNFIRLKIN
ncbi:DUF423 domain-containing protein [Galbibacter orientalis]|uniref:DUF423 domain-containing protein n=1 Tax=Galbibacter orientalis TaxID=453852 RepID=UPI00300252A2